MKLDLSGAARLDHAHLVWLDEIAAAAREPFNDLVRRLGHGREADIDWWVTPLASRNVFACPLFARCCRLLLALRVLDSGAAVSEIVVETPGCARALRAALATRKTRVPVRARRGTASFTTALILAFAYRMAAAVFNTINQVLFARLCGPAARAMPAGVVLIDTFLYRDSFRPEYRERHYPGLLECLTAEERRRVYFLPTYYKVRNYFALFRSLARSDINFLTKEQYLRVSDYAHALAHPLRALAFKAERCCFDGLEIAAMVNEALRESFAASGTIEALLRYRLAARLAQARLRVARVIDWFENQEVDHGSNAGFRRFLPDALILGYQGFVVSEQYLSAFPTSDEMRLALIPQRVAVTGEALVERCRMYCPELAVCIAPAFRFAGLWRERKPRASGDAPRVLVALPLMRDEVAAMLELVTAAVAALEGRWRIGAKAHPSFTQRLPRELELVEGDFDALLDDCDILVSTASSACVQALARGVPVAVVANPYGITFNPVPRDAPADMWALCHTAAGLARALTAFAGRDETTVARHRAEGVALLARVFSPVTPEAVSAFIGIETGSHAGSAAALVPQC